MAQVWRHWVWRRNLELDWGGGDKAEVEEYWVVVAEAAAEEE